jgi:hypothetical protein
MYSETFILPVRSGKNDWETDVTENITVDLDVDWGDGTSSKFLTPPTNREDTNYTHSYAGDALGGAAEKDFVVRVTGTCISGGLIPGSGGTHNGKFGMGYNGMQYGDASGANGSLSYGTWNYGNKDKIIKVAGNITALTTGAATLNNAYFAAFWDCRKLEDISGLVFTDEGNQGTNFLARTFGDCIALETIPENFIPPNVTAGAGFLTRTFEIGDHYKTNPNYLGLGLKTIPANFLPRNLTTAGASFLDRAFAGCAVTSIPYDFIPTGLATVGDNFLDSTFYKSQVASIPEGFVSNITSVGNAFLDSTFSDTPNLSALPANFFAPHYTTIGTWFASNTFTKSGITEVPETFIPAASAFSQITNYFFFTTFADCLNLVSANLKSFAGTYTVQSEYETDPFDQTFIGCSNLQTLVLSYCSGGFPFCDLLGTNDAYNRAGDNLEIYIYGDSVLETLLAPFFCAYEDPLTQVSKVYVKESLIQSYKDSDSWINIEDSKFNALP